MVSPRPVQSPLLVGRDELLARAERRIEDAAGGRGQLLMLAGEAGVGKTRLLGAILRKAGTAGFRAARGDLAPQDRQVPLASVLDLARTMRQAPAFGSLGPTVLGLLEEGRWGGDNLGSRRLLVRDLADLVISSTDMPTVLAFEDLQWADELTLEVVAELARLARERPLLLIAAFRKDELPMGSGHREWRARVLSQRLGEELVLRPLTRDETALMTTLILGTGLPAPRDVVNAIHDRTDGIPLHVEELLAALDDDARIDGAAIRAAHVPDTIEDAVLARTARLSDEARAVARAGAVIGRCFAPDVLAGCMDRPVAELEAPLAELVNTSFLYPFEVQDRGYYDFRHQLLRDAVYGTVPPSELRRLHARAGEFGSQLIGASEVHASVHFERAGLRSQAYRAALAGARAASAVSSRREAFELYARAAANAPDGLPPAELAALYDGYCEAALAIDNVPEIDCTATIARRHHLEAGQTLDAAYMLLVLAANARRDVRPVAEREELLLLADAELERLAPGPERDLMRSEVRLTFGLIEMDAGQYASARALFAEARAFRAASSDPETEDVDYFVASIDALAGRVGDGLESIFQVARRARNARRESTGVTAFRWGGATAVRLMEYEAAAVGVREGLRYAAEIEQSYCRHVLAATSAHLAWAGGRWDEAVATAEIELVEQGSRRGTLGSRDALGFVALGRGEVTRARQLLGESLAIGRAAGELDLVLPAMWGLAETALVAGEPDLALAQCEEALLLLEPTEERALLVPFVVTGVRAGMLARKPDAAERWLARVAPLLGGDWAELAQPALDHAAGLIRTSAGATVSARAALEAAVAGWDARGRAWEAAWSRLDLAACLLRANRHAEAMPHVEEVRRRGHAMASAPILARVAELVGVVRGRGPVEESWSPLTARELQVARLVAAGLTNPAIGEAIHVSARTVGSHVEHILAKLGATRRAEIASWVTSLDTAGAGARR